MHEYCFGNPQDESAEELKTAVDDVVSLSEPTSDAPEITSPTEANARTKESIYWSMIAVVMSAP